MNIQHRFIIGEFEPNHDYKQCIRRLLRNSQQKKPAPAAEKPNRLPNTSNAMAKSAATATTANATKPNKAINANERDKANNPCHY